MNRLVIGSPDKSNLLLTFMQEDFERGFLLIDPDGRLAEVAANTIPPNFTQHVFYLDPSDLKHPPGLNVLAGIAPDDRHPLAENICAYFEAMWPDGWGARSNYILLNCLRLLLDTPGSTFLGIPKLLTDIGYRTRCKGHCTDPMVLRFWEQEFEAWDEKFRREAIAPLQNKLGALLTSPTIRNIVGQQHSTFSLEKDKIIIANLDRAKLGQQTAFLLSSLLIARSRGPVYINDLGFLASEHLASLLPQERFTLSLRFLDELPKKLQQGVLTIEEKYVFKTNREDAERLAFYVGVMNPSMIMDLDADTVRTTQGKATVQPMKSLKRLAAIRKRSRACHTRPRLKVERAVRRFLDSARFPKAS
jgi:hypothetical protein